MKIFIGMTVFILIQSLGILFNISLLLNIFLLLLLWFNFIYSFYGLTAQERILRTKYPLKFTLSPIYLLKVMLRSLKIKYIIIKTVISNVLTKQLKLNEFLKLFIVITISIILLRYYRLEVIHALKLDDLVSDLLTLISLFMWMNMPNYLYIIEVESESPDVIGSLVSYMKRTSEEIIKQLKRDISPKAWNARLEIPWKVSNVGPFKVSKYVENKGFWVLRSLVHHFRRTFTGFEVFDSTNPYPCEELLNQPTPAKKLEYYQKYVYEINQCRRLKPTDNKAIIEAVDSALVKEIVPFVATDLNYYFINNILDSKYIDPRHLGYEITYGEKLRWFFAGFNRFIAFLPTKGAYGESDFLIFTKDGLVQFGQLKFRGSHKDIIREIPESLTKYKRTDWSIFLTIDEMLVEQKIYDKPYDLENRKCIGVKRIQSPLNNPFIIQESIVPKPFEFTLNFQQWNNFNEKINLQNEVLKRDKELQKSAIQQKKDVVKEINFLGSPDDHCLKPSEIKKRKNEK